MLGILPGIIGVIQATEAVKLIIGKGEPLIGRLMHYDALAMKFREFKLRRNPKCPMCGDSPTITELIDYEEFCGVPANDHQVEEDPAALPEITPIEFEKIRDQVELIDVRPRTAFAKAHIPGSLNVELSEQFGV